MSFPEFGEIISRKEEVDFPQFGEIIEESETSFQPPSLKEEVGRHALRTASRVGESLVGLPGDILNIPKRLASTGLGKIPGVEKEKVSKALKSIGPPSSEEIKDLSFKIFGEKVIPQNKTERLADDIVSDASVLAIPVKGKIPFLRAIGTAAGANLAEKGAEMLGVGEKGQAAVKLGTFLLAGLTGKGNVKKYYSKEYELAKDSIPKNTKVQAFGLDRQIDHLERNLTKGISTPSKKFVLNPIKEIRNKIKKGTVKVEDLIEIKKDLNEIRGSLYKDLGTKQSVKYAQGKINDLATLLDDQIAEYGKSNSKFLSHYTNANQAFSGFQQSKKVSNWINKVLPFKNMSKGKLMILEAIFKPAALAVSVPAIGVLKGSELLARVFRNRSLRSFYGNLMKDAVKENRTGVLKNISKIEEGLKKEEPDLFD